MLVPIRRALLSVSDKSGIVDLARQLSARGVEIVSTGGTAATLADAGLEVIRVEDLTGFPEMLGGRVKTLHPVVHGAVLARRDIDEDTQTLRDHDITPIDLVCVSLYPFEETVRRPGVTVAEALEQIDIGGPAMIRSAAKNHMHVTVVTATNQFDELLEELDRHDGATTLEFRRRLATAAFHRTAAYDTLISAWMATGAPPDAIKLALTGRIELRYGENPHQAAALYADPAADGPSVVTARVLHGKALSYNNVQDAAAALDLLQDLHALSPGQAAAAVIKHTNPCGAAVADSLAEAFARAHDGDPLAAYGGILAVSRTFDAATAEAVCEGRKFLEVIVAPEFDKQAMSLLGARWKSVRLLAVGALRPPSDYEMTWRSVPGGMLVQQRDTALPDAERWTHDAGPPPDDRLIADAVFACAVVKHLKSNAIAITSARQLLGAASGLVDRVNACRLAVEKAGERIHRSPAVAASEAFFPFPDGPEVLIDAGVKCIVQPGGSKRDRETLDVCEQRGVTCLLTGVRHFRH